MKKESLKQTIQQGFAGLFHICKQELKAIFKDQGVLIFFLLVPLAYPLVYAFIYTNEVVREVPVAVIDNSNTALSRQFIRTVDASADVHIQSHCADMEEGKNLLKETRVYGILYIPESFSKDIASGKQTTVSIYCDMSGMLYYKALVLASTNASLTLNKKIQIQRMGNTTERQDEVSTAPIEYEDVSLFNPQDGFASFLIPAVLILIIQQTLLLGIGLSAGTARENNRFKDLVPISRQYQGTLRIVGGKSLAYFLIYALVAAYVLCLVPQLFDLVQIAQPMTLLAFVVPYILACIFFAMTCSIFIHHRESCLMIYVYLRNLLAGSCRTYVLESILLDIPIYVWYQRVCKNQQHGRNSSGSVSRISGTLDTSYRIFLHNLHCLPPTNHIEPPACHGAPAYVQATKTGCQDIQITKL